MGTKMKGVLKGLRYISQIFDDDKEQEMQIGYPTDVKHVAHIGCDGPSVDSPSWMEEFESPAGFQSAPLAPPADCKENQEIKWVSEDSSSRRGTRAPNSPTKNLSELSKSSRRQSSKDNSLIELPNRDSSIKSRRCKIKDCNSSPSESPSRESSVKSKQSRRHQYNNSSDNSIKANRRQPQNASHMPDSPTRKLPDIPKKSRRNKSKESISVGGSSRSSRSKGTSSSTAYASPFSDPGSKPEIIVRSHNNELCQTSSLKPLLVQEEEKEKNSGIF